MMTVKTLGNYVRQYWSENLLSAIQMRLVSRLLYFTHKISKQRMTRGGRSVGLFINGNDHPDLFKNNEKIHASNQRVARHSSLTELINEQRKANMALAKSIAELKPRNEHLAAMLKKESLLKETIIDEIHHLSNTNQEMANRLEKNEEANEQLSLQLNKQLELQKETAEKLSNQEGIQAGVLKRLDHQEVLTEKISRQLNHIRSILFERTNHLAVKLEDGYKLTSSYVYKLMTGSDQPLTFSLMNHHKEEKQKHSD